MSKKFKILVLGEKLLDAFLIGKATRKAPEGAFLVFQPEKVEYNDGGAGNVVSNLKSLSPNSEIIFLHQKTEIKKTRLVDDISGMTLIRIDEHDKVLEDEKFKIEQLEEIFGSEISSLDLDAVAISDYGKGYLSTQDIEIIAEICCARNIPTFADVKFILGEWSKHLTYIKINSLEFENNLKVIKNPEKYCRNLIVTLGKDGSMLIKHNGERVIVPTKKIEINSLSGAGDSYHSALIISYLEKNSIKEMLSHANKAGSYAASRKGVISVPREAVF